MPCITSIGLAGIPLATGTTFSVGTGVGGGSGVRIDSATRRHVFGSFLLLSAIPMLYVPTDAFSLAWIVIWYVAVSPMSMVCGYTGDYVIPCR